MDAVQKMLQRQYPHIGGFQSTCLAEKFAMSPPDCKFIQILNVGDNHWLTISTIGCEEGSVNVFDSMNLQLSSTTKRLIADLLMTTKNRIVINYMNVQQQNGGSDCGLFAIIFAACLCGSVCPGSVNFDQKLMRNHLISCFEKGVITPFPKTNARTMNFDKNSTEEVPVFCVCRLPDNGSLMVQCDKCRDWFHTLCLNINYSKKCITKNLLLGLVINVITDTDFSSVEYHTLPGMLLLAILIIIFIATSVLANVIVPLKTVLCFKNDFVTYDNNSPLCIPMCCQQKQVKKAVLVQN